MISEAGGVVSVAIVCLTDVQKERARVIKPAFTHINEIDQTISRLNFRFLRLFIK